MNRKSRRRQKKSSNKEVLATLELITALTGLINVLITLIKSLID